MVGDLAGRHRITVGGDRGYDVEGFAAGLRTLGATPHLAQHRYVTKTGRRRRSSIDGRTTRHPGYAVSQRRRKLIEEAFAWIKTIAGQAKTRFRGLARVGLVIPARGGRLQPDPPAQAPGCRAMIQRLNGTPQPPHASGASARRRHGPKPRIEPSR